MYKHLDKLLAEEKKRIRTEFNRLSVMGFDELNVINTRKTTQEMFDRFMSDNEALYIRAAKSAYKKASETGATDADIAALVATILGGYNLVTGYLYDKEADRKRLRLNEQILTAREYNDRQMFQDGLRKTANLWWTQTAQYGISVVDGATIKAFKDMGVKRVKWVAEDDENTCSTCSARDNKIYAINNIPSKTHYGCRCYLTPVRDDKE